MNIRTSFLEFWRIVKEMPWRNAKPLGETFLGKIEAL